VQVGLVLAHLVESNHLVVVQKRLDDAWDLAVDNARTHLCQHERTVRGERGAAEVPRLEVERCALRHPVRACRENVGVEY
jgi:hypothetical protein